MRRRHIDAHRAQQARERSLLSLLVLASMVFVILAGLVLALSFLPNPRLLLGRPEIGSTTDTLDNFTIAGATVTVPAPLVARVERTLLRKVKRLVLQLPWPFDRTDLTTIRERPSDFTHWILVTLEPRDGRTAMEDRLEAIYAVYFDGKAEPEGALSRRRFKPDSPYADSVLYVAENGTVLRCDTKPSVLGPVLCERLLVLNQSLVARVSFAHSNLAAWEDIDTLARTLLAQFIKA